MKNKAFAPMALFCCLFGALWAQNPSADKQQVTGPWKDIQELSLPKRGQEDVQLPEKFRLLELDVEQLTAMLSKVPVNFSRNLAEKPRVEIELPLPDGSSERFEIYSDPIMHPDLARQYPEIQTFAGRSLNDPAKTIRMDLSPHGFNAQILTGNRGSIYLSPVTVGDNRYHKSYFKKDSRRSETWQCLTEGHSFEQHPNDFVGKELVGTCGTRREYRLALACTGEYTFFHGGTIALALAAMNTTMNRVNGVYERDCSVRMNIIANNTLIMYTNGATDPYTNGNANTMINENQTNVDAEILPANYDIGHVFDRIIGGSSGLAGPGPCTGSKAMGVTGSGNPVGDPFDIDFVAHEMGHQFNAKHTFNDNANGSCAGNLTAAAAFEPGSGSTILAYAGICSGVDLQPNSDDYFHAFSLQEIVTYVQSGSGSTCGTTFPVANSLPTVNAGANFTIPASTPFKLTASGSDPDGSTLRYCWEQMDNQLISHPPASTATGGPVFRSFYPTTSPTRFFPMLPAILNSALSTTWEVLPSVSRTLNFRVTARDFGAGGGCTEEDDMAITVVGSAGPFTVTSTGVDANCLFAEDNTTINWNVANTNAAPVNCTNVDIWLSLDGGNNFTILLANNTPNDGSQVVAIPANAVTSQGRIMVMASNNIFFDINDNDININCPSNTTVTTNPVSGVVKVRQKIETLGPVVVLPATSAKFYAGEEVRLKPGFWAQRGSDFQAKIQPCDACTATRPESLITEKGNPKVNFYELPSSDRTRAYADSPLKAFAFPNPFDQNFTVSFDLPTAGKVDIQLMDLTGRHIQTVYQNDFLEAGTHQIPVTSSQLAVGVYGCRITSNGQQAQIKLVKIN